MLFFLPTGEWNKIVANFEIPEIELKQNETTPPKNFLEPSYFLINPSIINCSSTQQILHSERPISQST